jgi:iron complex transport system substrate-binding protein
MIRPGLAQLWLCTALTLACGCGPRATQTSTPASVKGKGAALDWVFDPDVAAEERAVPCLRLLSAGPNVTEICCALGLGQCLIGRTRYCTYPPSVQAVPSIGALNDLNVETLVALQPDLVLVSGTSRAITERLARLPLRYETVPDWTLADLFTGIEKIGELTGRPMTARRLAEHVHADLEAVAARFSNQPQARVLLLTAPLPDPPAHVDAVGPGSFYDDLLRMAGYTNVVDASAGMFAPLGLEYVLRADPDVIIELAPDARLRPAGDADAQRAWAKLGSLKAAAAGRVHVLVGEQYFVLGPRIGQTFAALCERIGGTRHE